MKFISFAAIALLALSGCATPQAPFDYSALRASRPSSILVLPPINHTPDINAAATVFSHTTLPLAESGYYVTPITIVADAFKQNGVTDANEIHATAHAKLREIFAADAVLYITISEYGSVYRVLSSETKVTAEARLVDLRSGAPLWAGTAVASSNEGKSNSGDLVSVLLSAIISQVMDSLNDKSDAIAKLATGRLLYAGEPNRLLPGPRLKCPEQKRRTLQSLWQAPSRCED